MIAPFGQVFSHFLHPIHPIITGGSYCFALCMGTASYECLLFVWHQAGSGDAWTLWQHTYHRLCRLPGSPLLHHRSHGSHQTDRPLRSFRSPGSRKCTALRSAAWDKCHHLAVFHAGITDNCRLSLSQVPLHFTYAAIRVDFYCFLSHDSGNDSCRPVRRLPDRRLTGASPFAMAAARPSQPGYPQPPQLFPGRASRTRNFSFICFNSKLLAGSAQGKYQ